MKFNRLPIVCAAFLIVAMTIQFVMSYHREKVELEERIQYKMELAQKDFFFEVYDMHEATNEIRHFYSEFDTDSTELYALLETVLWHYPELYSCYLVFLPERSPEPGRWFVPCAFRVIRRRCMTTKVNRQAWQVQILRWHGPGVYWTTACLTTMPCAGCTVRRVR